MDVKIKPSFVRMRKRCRAVLVVPSHQYDLAPLLRRRNFYPIVLPVGVLDQELKRLWLSGRTLVIDRPDEFDADEVCATFPARREPLVPPLRLFSYCRLLPPRETAKSF
jgi:hypothetical protein